MNGFGQAAILLGLIYLIARAIGALPTAQPCPGDHTHADWAVTSELACLISRSRTAVAGSFSFALPVWSAAVCRRCGHVSVRPDSARPSLSLSVDKIGHVANCSRVRLATRRLLLWALWAGSFLHHHIILGFGDTIYNNLASKSLFRLKD